MNDIVRRRRAVTAEMALRFARYFGTSAELWQNLQAQYDLEVATAKIGTTVHDTSAPREAEPPRNPPSSRGRTDPSSTRVPSTTLPDASHPLDRDSARAQGECRRTELSESPRPAALIAQLTAL